MELFHSFNIFSCILHCPSLSTPHLFRAAELSLHFHFYFPKHLLFHHLLGQGHPVRHVVIKRTTAAHTAHLDQNPCTVRLPGIPSWLVEGRGTLSAGPYGEHMRAQESRLCQDRTPLTAAFSLLLSIRSAQHVHHMWTSSWIQNKHFRSQG